MAISRKETQKMAQEFNVQHFDSTAKRYDIAIFNEQENAKEFYEAAAKKGYEVKPPRKISTGQYYVRIR